MARRLLLPRATAALLGLVVLPTTVGGQEPTGQPTGQPTDPAVLEAWLELEAAGLAPSAEEQADLLAEQAEAAGSGPAGGIPGEGSLRVRGYFFPEEPWRRDGRLDLVLGPGRLQGRYVQGGEQPGLAGGTLEVGFGPLGLVGGYLGLQGGFGLLLARSGRTGSLAADGKLELPRGRLSRWATWPDRRTLQGAGLRWGGGGWELQAAGGRTPQDGLPVFGGNLVWAGEKTLIGMSGLQVGPGRGLSLWGGGRREFLEWNLETAGWLPASDQRAQLSWQATVGLAPDPRWGLQGGWAQGRGGPRSPLGARPAFLAGDEGWGWALGGHWKPRRAWRMSLLATASEAREIGGEPRRDAERVWDAIAVVGAGPGLRLDLRLRSKSTRRWAWSERYPWQAPVPLVRESRLQGQLGVEGTSGERTLKAGFRWLQVAEPAESSRRWLGYVGGTWRWGPHWRGRAGYGAAWGAEQDLVSAVAPLPGLVLPRHWGSWRSETYGGLGWVRGNLAVWAAFSWRRPAGEEALPGAWQGWLDGRLAW